MNPLLSIVVCTFRRAEDLTRLLACLAEQSYGNFEVLIVDGDAESSASASSVEAVPQDVADRIGLRRIASPRGLTRQRNVGLDHARGDLIAFLDDDVSFAPDFLTQVVDLYCRPELERVGGICGYDVLHYPGTVGWRWQIRYWLGSVPALAAGSCDHLGRNSPLSIARPFTGTQTVGWLSGFCMIYRREAIAGLRFDETLPTHGGEDRDFSLSVSRLWGLRMCGALHVQHHSSPTGRSWGHRRLHEIGFGAGRSFAKRARGLRDHLTIARYILVECLIDTLGILKHPGVEQFLLPWARLQGFVAGYRSAASTPQTHTSALATKNRDQCVTYPAETSSS